jgi:Ni/Fe-hydrogenase subunit HybB-like protein
MMMSGRNDMEKTKETKTPTLLEKIFSPLINLYNWFEKYKEIDVPNKLLLILLPFVAIFAVIILIRFIWGIGIVSNMSDGYPWGIWITYDVVVGTALGTGGYTMAFLIYLFNKGEYHPLIRSAVMTSAFGYTLAGFSVILDLGRWWNILSMLTPSHWNTNSVLLEVALCIMGYCLVTWIELSPAFLDKFKINYNKKVLNKILLFVIALAMLLPTMHQSSLGTMMVIAGQKVYPLWQTNFLPLLSIISIFFMGYSVVVAESFASSLLLNRPYETKMVKKLAPIISWVGIIWVVFRFVVLTIEGKLGLIFTSGGYSFLFLIEMFLVIGGIYVLMNKKPVTPKKLLTGAFLLLAGGSLFRFSVYLIAYDPGKGYSYFPSVPEIFITLGVISTELLLYLLFVKYLPILHKAE